MHDTILRDIRAAAGTRGADPRRGSRGPENPR